MNQSFDKHLNIFWQYNGNPYLEDNITRALITTLSLSSKEVQKKIIDLFLSNTKEYIELKDEELDIKFDLQNPFIKDIKDQNCKKFLVGFSPNGKVWSEDIHEILKKTDREIELNMGIVESDSKLENFLKEKNVNKEDIREKKEYFREALKSIINRGESRPDAWIFIYKKGEKVPIIIIALENKLWSLDPFQLKNHLEKSLGIEKENNNIKLIKYEEICNVIKGKSNQEGIENHFLDYMELLGYYIKINKFTSEDISFAIENNEFMVIKNKWEKFFRNYFESDSFRKLNKLLKARVEIKTKRIYFDGLIGNLYFDILTRKKDIEEGRAMFIGTEIGVGKKDLIIKLKEMLKKEEINELNEIYKESDHFISEFSIFKRLNSKLMSRYFGVADYSKIRECLNDFSKENVYMNKINKDKCLKILKEYNKKNDSENLRDLIGKVENWKFGEKKSSEYNLLSYLRFVDYIKYSFVIDKNIKDLEKKFSNLIIRHYNGLKKVSEVITDKKLK